jgi:hypothetical protein
MGSRVLVVVCLLLFVLRAHPSGQTIAAEQMITFTAAATDSYLQHNK